MNCRFCNTKLDFEFIDLINSPPSNSFLTKDQLNEPEKFYPLKLLLCTKCLLVQIDEYKKSNEIFNENYLYYSSFSKIWLDHAKNYVDLVLNRFKLNKDSYVIEIGSNDGYLLQYFQKLDIPCLGIEPSSNTAKIAIEKGIKVIEDYFSVSLAKKLVEQNLKADLIVGNNVLAQIPKINDFIQGLKILLKEKGIITMEFPHIMQLIENNQFDTIYHEHFSYFSFITIKKIFKYYGFEIFDVEELQTHGGSLRIYAKHQEDQSKRISDNVKNLYNKEFSKKMNSIKYYMNFQEKIDKIKNNFLQFLINQKLEGKNVIAYGAAAKGNTLLNYCGVKKDLISFVVDISPYKQGLFLPASHIPVVDESTILKVKPDFIVILPWNIKNEIMDQLSYTKKWGCKFVIPIPEVAII
ncbi:MAG: methyltransferase domain-containing protein [Promethearchaeota archaeon]